VRVLFLTHFFPPEIGPPQTRILETARDLQQMGHAVAVLTTFPNYPSGEIPAGYRGRVLMREEMEGIPVVRSWLYAAPNRGFLRRSLSHLSFALSALPAATRLPWRPDVIVVDMHPLFLCVTAAILGRWWGVPYVLNAGDLIPEQAVAYGVMRNPIAIRVTRALASFALNHAAQVVPFTRGIEAALRERGIPPERLHLIYYGADVELFQEPIPEGETIPGLESIAPDAFVVMYAGTHGLPHALDTVLDTAELLADEPDVEVLGEQRRVGHALGEAPVELELPGSHLPSIVDDALHARMQREVFRHLRHQLREALELRHRHARVDGFRETSLLIARPVDRVLVAEHAERVLVRISALVEAGPVSVGDLFDLFLRNDA